MLLLHPFFQGLGKEWPRLCPACPKQGQLCQDLRRVAERLSAAGAAAGCCAADGAACRRFLRAIQGFFLRCALFCPGNTTLSSVS